MMLSLSYVLAACSRHHSPASPTLYAGNWGILENLEARAPARSHLIDIKDQGGYEVCFQSSLAARWPEFKAELEVALAHWGRYIGASVLIHVREEVFPTLPREMNSNEALTFYKAAVCKNADLIVAEHTLDGDLGRVVENYTYRNENGKIVIKKFEKALFIQKEGPKFKWITFDEAFKEQAISSAHEKLFQRSLYYTKKDSSEHLLMSTLLHEAGHVWGLCDQYQLARGETNCHPVYSSDQLVEDSIMASEKIITPVFLSNDDIDGIEELAKRRRDSWHPIAIRQQASIPAYEFIGAKVDSTKAEIKIAISRRSTIKGSIELKVFDEQGDHASLSADIDVSAQEKDLFQSIEFGLDPRWQVTGIVFTSDAGVEQVVPIIP